MRASVAKWLAIPALLVGVPLGNMTAATAAAHQRPRIVVITAVPDQLPSPGGRVVVLASLKNGKTCQLKLMVTHTNHMTWSRNPKSCTSSFSAFITFGPNRAPAAERFVFRLVARNSFGSTAGNFAVTVAGTAASSEPVPTTPTSSTPTATTTPGLPPAPTTTLVPTPSTETTQQRSRPRRSLAPRPLPSGGRRLLLAGRRALPGSRCPDCHLFVPAIRWSSPAWS